MSQDYSAWNPGLESDIPPAYRPLETIYRPENVTTSIAAAHELSARTSLGPEELVVFKPARLALHELVVRVTADVLVLEGGDETELGRNFRRICNRIHTRYLLPRMDELRRVYDDLRALVEARIQQELAESLFSPRAPEPVPETLFGLIRRKTNKAPSRPAETTLEREQSAIASFRDKGLGAEDPLDKAVYKGLYRVLGSIAGNRGYLGPDQEFLTDLVCDYVCNRHGSEVIGKAMAPWILNAIEQEGIPTIPNAEKPLLMSLKGASAAGKSSLRPMLSEVMSDQGMAAVGYGTISPDVWRRLLLDFESLGEAYKYAGRLTGRELVIIDGKLDRYIRAKAERQGTIPHLLVDRFRFDSFSTERISKVLHATYLRHVDTLLMYFVVTPPHATVERGWERGRRTGRYKAVEDYLDHSVEAYVGMPKILLKWLAYDRPLFKYEFLDNSVPKGTFPRRVAYGTQTEINIIECSVFVDIVRYQKINIRAKSPAEVYPRGQVSSVRNNIGFLRQCIKMIPTVNFVDPNTGKTYIRARKGDCRVLDEAILARRLEDAERAQIFEELAPRIC